MGLTMNKILAPISVGELLDKITILQIKSKHTTDQSKLDNINLELQDLQILVPELNLKARELMNHLQYINQTIWNIEDHIRDLEKNNDFGSDFVETARKIYKNNDLRAKVKREINEILGSYIIEEKIYD
jgi:dolichyl-phosphate-mannose--protein O-mannosyl transferase